MQLLPFLPIVHVLELALAVTLLLRIHQRHKLPPEVTRGHEMEMSINRHIEQF